MANLLRCGGEGPINRAGASLHMLRLLSVDIIAACIEEAPSITTSSLPLSGNIFLHPAASPPLCLPCHPAIALALANVANVACYISRDIFASASVTIHDMDTVYESHEGVTFELPHEATPTPDKAGASVAGPACKLLAEDVFQMSSCVLRAQLRAEGVAVTSTEARESLLAKLAPRLDEVQRRELGILHAAKEGDYRRAAELQKGRSRRGELLEELRRSEREGEWGKAVRLGGVIRGIEGGIMDVTAEPGSYQRDLDRDEWYRPNR